MRATKILLIVIGVLAILGVVGYQRLDDSQKRFVQELARQVPYLIPRYYV